MSKVILAIYVVATSLGLIVLKLGTKAGPPVDLVHHRIHFNINLYTVGGTTLYGASFILYIYLISKNDLGYIIPVASAFIYVLIFLASYVIFKEVFTITKIIGIVLIICGLVVINVKS